ncbi:NifB/NifX family molybdenum-iron cluster-binding protein [Desulfomonile tiedjei]|nr:NifB/NifX family molybdenum-iron cluster-binding protein [Desulfomonile tiedjei]
MKKSKKTKLASNAPSGVMNVKRVLVPLLGDDVAPRFDLAPEALIATVDSEGRVAFEKSIVLPQASAETLCRLIMSEKIDMVICCAIEEEYYQYLAWKKIHVVDSVIGPFDRVLDKLSTGSISSGEVLLDD